MQEETCDTCTDIAEYYDAYGTPLCTECVKDQLYDDESLSWDDFERI